MMMNVQMGHKNFLMTTQAMEKDLHTTLVWNLLFGQVKHIHA